MVGGSRLGLRRRASPSGRASPGRWRKLSGPVDGEKPGDSRPVLVGLMEKYADYAKQQTRCGSSLGPHS